MIEIKGTGIDFRFDHHVNLIGGADFLDSGNGKTRLYEHMLKLFNNGLLYANKTLVFMPTIESAKIISLDSSICLILDEVTFSPEQLNELFMIIKNSDSNVIVVSRLFVKQFECSVDAIYRLSCNSQGNFILDRYFKNGLGNKRTDVIVCEDATSIAFVYTDALQENVIPANGKDLIYKHIKRSKNPLVIADKPKFGISLLNLVYKCAGSTTETIQCFLPSCFEEIVLEIEFPEQYGNVMQQAYVAFDAENAIEDYLNDKSDVWDKEHTAQSVKDLVNTYDLSKSSVLGELAELYQGKAKLSDRMYCIDVAQSDIKDVYTPGDRSVADRIGVV